MIHKAPAKINVGLDILSKRPDGFHTLESLFVPLPFYDLIEFREASSFSLSNTGITVDCAPEENLLYKTWEVLHKKYNIPPIELHLHKQIPFGAGLGGGSSDATTLLMALNNHFSLSLSRQDLHDIAQSLGSDCPFFLFEQPMFTKGTGNEFEPSPIDLSGIYYALYVPDIPINTPWAYKQITPKNPTTPLKTKLLTPMNQWQNQIKNDFEEAVFAHYPQIRQLKNALIDAGANYVSLSGSGSAVFALSKEPLKAGKINNTPLLSYGKL